MDLALLDRGIPLPEAAGVQLACQVELVDLIGFDFEAVGERDARILADEVGGDVKIGNLGMCSCVDSM